VYLKSGIVTYAQDCFEYSESFVLPYDFWDFFSYFGEKVIGVFMAVALIL
jgi:hypothetical protein